MTENVLYEQYLLYKVIIYMYVKNYFFYGLCLNMSTIPVCQGVHASSLEEVADVVYISFGKPELKLCVKSMGTDVWWILIQDTNIQSTINKYVCL